ncbi:MAG: multidrug efflux RND transporter permease subunit [Planctomycetota bacterium]
MSRLFINRPILASVISIVIVIAGAVSQLALPVAKFPEVAPPTVQVQCFYPGASAQVVADTVAQPIEQEVNGVEGMLYLSSVSSDDGSYTLTVTFEVGVDLDIATVLVQNRVAIAEPKIPEEVRRQGVTTKKQSTQTLLYIAMSSDKDESGKPAFSALELSNFAYRNIKDELSRINGVGEVTVFGADEYGMRVWLDPPRLKARGLTTQDVVDAISEQNVQVAAGRVGEPPAPTDTAFQFAVNTLGRLESVEQFENIIVKTGERTETTRVRDVARVELGAKSYSIDSRYNGQPSANIAVYQLPGANALDVATEVRAVMEKLAGRYSEFRRGMNYTIPYDTTRFVEASVEEVYSTLFQAVALVVIVIFVFLQDWRATLVPCAAIPVALIGTFAVMAALGLSINMLTLFGIVLAIGIVVDDSIVVVENTTRLLDEGLPRKEAAIQAMNEMTGPVIATTLVLLAVFVPTAFLGGITGQLYRQFALTISAAVIFSTINALSLSPALCGLLLRPSGEKKNPFFRAFNAVFDTVTAGYSGIVGASLRAAPVTLLIFVGLVTLTALGFTRLPSGFLPTEDQGYVFANVQLPDGASLERTQEVIDKIDAICAKTPGVKDRIAIAGYSILSGSRGSNAGFLAIVFEPWGDRTTPETSQPGILGNLMREFSQIQEAVVVAFPPPAIDGLGNAGGFQAQLVDVGNAGLQELQAAAQDLVQRGNGQSGLSNLNTVMRADVPQLFVDVDREKVKALDVPLGTVFGTLQAYLGSAYVNDFNLGGRTYQVRVQADSEYRVSADDVKDLDVRNLYGQMLPMGAVVSVSDAFGPQVVQRYNLYPSAQINGQPEMGFSSGQALTLMENMAESELPKGVMDILWTGMSYQEKQVGGEQYLIFALAIVLVFLVLAAQYESWVSPAAVVAVVPVAALGVVVMLMVRGMDNNTYTQIGIVLLVALASKNAILIVEFASELRRAGKTLREAAAEAARLRFRAILMTAFSSILGFLPLLLSSGAGAASRQAVGNSVVGGMIAATVSSLLFVPVFFYVFRGLGEWLGRAPKPEAEAPAETN